MKWNKLIEQIMEKDPKQTYETIGKQVGMSRSSVGRMVKDPVAAEPRFSVGMKLINLHESVLKTNEPTETKDDA